VELEPDQLGGGGRVGDLDPARRGGWLADRGGGAGDQLEALDRGARRAGGRRDRGAAVALACAVLEVRAALVLDVAQALQELGVRWAAAMAGRRTTCARPASARWSR